MFDGKRKGIVIAVIAVAAVALPARVHWALAAERSPRPELVIPKLAEPPVVDGVLEEGEWDRAALITGFIAATGSEGGRMVPIDSKIYLGHDAKRFYMAVYCELPPGGKPTMTYRRRDEPVYMDRYQLELWLAPPVRDKLVAYQMIGNAYGAIYDCRHIPSLGARSSGWNGKWELKSTYKTGEYWTAELSVAFAELDKAEVRPDRFWGGMAGIAWPQRSWPYTYGWYSNVDTHAKMYMSDTGSCVRVDSLASLFDNRLAPELTLVNGEAQDAEFTVEVSVSDVKHVEKVKVGAGGAKKVTFEEELPEFAPGLKSKTCRLVVTGPGGKTLIAGDWPFRPVPEAERKPKPVEPKPWQLSTRMLFAPLAMGIKAWADLLDYPRRDALAAVRFTVRPRGGGEPVISKDITRFNYDCAETYLWLPRALPYGDYEVVTAFLDKAGKVLDRKADAFAHKDLKKEFVWLNTDYGEDFTPAPPFEPLKVEGRTFKVWGRELRMSGALPEEVISQGRQMLARPINFVAVVGGRAVPAEISQPIRITNVTDARAQFTGEYRLAGLRLKLSGYVDFDGVIYYTLSAEPVSAERPVIDRLYVSMPVKAENALYYHSTAGGWSPSLGVVPSDGAEGVVWSSAGVADFVPYVGLSDDDRCIQWFADNDHDWVLGKDAPCAQLVRKADAVELQVNLVRRKGRTGSFGAKFGFVVTPVKPLPSGWRHVSLHFGNVAGSKLHFFYGPGHGGCPIDLHDTAKLCKVLNIDTGGRNPDVVLNELPAGSAPLDKQRVRQLLGSKAADYVSGMGPGSAVHQCYFFNAKMYFPGYRSKAFRTFFPGEWQLDPPSGWFHLTPTESYQDFFSFYMNIWLKHWVVNGLYFDECYLGPDYNVFNGNGKVMPDGTVRPSVPLMRQRRFLNRMRQLFLDNNRKPFIWVHTTNYMAPYAISAADVAMFGEDRVPTPAIDMIDAIPAALMRTIGRSQKFGFIPLWMVQAGRGGDGNRFVARQTYGWCWMHDTVPEYHTSVRGWPLVYLRKGWGIDEDDVEFIPYWNNAGSVKTDDPKFIVSSWTRPGGRVLLQVMNLHHENEGKTRVAITLNPEALGLPDQFTTYDLESQPELVAWEKRHREADRLRKLDPAANAKRIAELTAGNSKIIDEIRYDKSLWQKLGTGATIKLSVPARDFKALVVE